jgi:hypothetical protein
VRSSSARIDRDAVDVEMLWIARSLGLWVAEIPVAGSNDSHSKVLTARGGVRGKPRAPTLASFAARG